MDLPVEHELPRGKTMRIKAICLGMSKRNGDSDMAIMVVRTNMRGRSDEKRQKFL